MTPPIRGYDIDSYSAGDRLCKDYYGLNAKFADFKDGYYVSYMNTAPKKTWKFWKLSESVCGAWSMWGYFNHNYQGRTWVWIDSQPNGNCGDI